MSALMMSVADASPPFASQPDLILEANGLSHVGKVRAHNEDSVQIDGDTGCYVLSDGMGGYNAGEVASAIAVDVIVKKLANFKQNLITNNDPDPVATLAEAIEESNRKIIETGALRPECLGMGATVVAVMLLDTQLWYAHVGDSRLYRYRNGQLVQLTKDHSVGQELSDSGVMTKEEARHYQGRGILTRALGVEPDVRPDVGCSLLMPGDIYLICSDGLSDMVGDQRINEIVNKRRNTSCNTIALGLQQEALEAGGTDNVSSIVIRCVSSES